MTNGVSSSALTGCPRKVCGDSGCPGLSPCFPSRQLHDPGQVTSSAPVSLLENEDNSSCFIGLSPTAPHLESVFLDCETVPKYSFLWEGGSPQSLGAACPAQPIT